MPDLGGYTHSQLISVTGNKPAAPQAWFPMLVAFDADAGLNDYTQNAGLDVAFTLDGDDTELPYEREEWNDLGATITARFWVRVPSIDSASDTDLRMHIGKAGGTAYATPEDTWDENGAQNFIFRHPMADDPDVRHIVDSTVNANNGLKQANNVPLEVAGYVGRAQSFVGGGTLPRITLGNDATLDTTAAITMECLIDWDDTGDTSQRLFDKATAGPSMYIGRTATDKLGFYGAIGGVQRNGIVGNTALTAGWKHVALTWDDADDVMRAYLDGAPDGTEVGWSGALATNANLLYVGDNAGGARSFQGEIDEARWSKIARPAPWVKFTADNILDYAATITHGAWEAASEVAALFGGSLLSVTGIGNMNKRVLGAML